MRLANGHISPTNWRQWREFLRSSGASYALFGDAMLIFAPEEEWANVDKQAAEISLALQPYPHSVAEENLHLVVQVGNDFLNAHDTVPVIIDRGRYLAVNVTLEQARRVQAAPSGDFTINPLRRSQVVFRQRPPIEPSSPVPWVRNLVDDLSPERVVADIEHLVAFRTRLSPSTKYAEAARWAVKRLRDLRYEVEMQPVEVGSGRSFNVVARKPGKQDMGPIVAVTAHLDSINWPGGPAADAPGADDNASGCAGLLEIARVLSPMENVHELRFVLFGWEEQGRFGSKKYVEGISEGERERFRKGAAVNMDMIATVNDTPLPTVLLETATSWTPVALRLADAASTYGQLAVQHDFNPQPLSDHYSFISRQLPGVLTIEGASGANKRIHTIGDDLTHISTDLMMRILRMNTAFVADPGTTNGYAPRTLRGRSADDRPPVYVTGRRPTSAGSFQIRRSTVNDSQRPEDTTKPDRADEERKAGGAQNDAPRRGKVGELRTKDHLPPILLSDSSFVVEIKERLAPREDSGKSIRPHRYPTRHPLMRVLIIDGFGDVLYKRNNVADCELHFWMDPHDPDDPPQVVLRDESASRISVFETDHEFETPDANTVSKFRPFVYRHPRNDEERFFVHRLRVVKGNQMLFQYIADPDHAEGLQVWLWQTGL